MEPYIPAATKKGYKPTAEGLAEYAKKAYSSPNVYVWGGFGEYLTDEILDEKIARWPDWYVPEQVEFRRILANRNIRGYDCIGLIEAYLWNDYSQYNPWLYKPEEFLTTAELIARNDLVKGDMEHLPERPGLVLWRSGHVGVYIGNGKVIESTTRIEHTAVVDKRVGGIIMSDFKEDAKLGINKWECWLEYPGIKY